MPLVIIRMKKRVLLGVNRIDTPAPSKNDKKSASLEAMDSKGKSKVKAPRSKSVTAPSPSRNSTTAKEIPPPVPMIPKKEAAPPAPLPFKYAAAAAAPLAAESKLEVKKKSKYLLY